MKLYQRPRQQEQVVQFPGDDIYLCDNCDAEFEGLSKMKVAFLGFSSTTSVTEIENVLFFLSPLSRDQNLYHRSTKRFALEMTAAQAHARLRLITFSLSRKLIRTISFSIFTLAHQKPSRPGGEGPSHSLRASSTRVPTAASRVRQTWPGVQRFPSPRPPVC